MTEQAFPCKVYTNGEKTTSLFRDLTTEHAVKAREDESYRNQFIAENRIFIRIAAARTVHHFVTEHDDEWSVALVAFNEAIDKYTPEKGSFSAFARTVIQNRLTDELRRNYRRESEIPFDPLSLEGGEKHAEVTDPLTVEIQKKLEEEAQEAEYTPALQAREEIEAVQKILNGYGFSFYDLTECSPKAAKTKTECAKAVIALLEDEDLFRRMQEKHTLPVEGILQAADVKKKILERHRRYIIAAAEILHGEYPLLARYMEYIRAQIPI